uniref:Lipocalin/cytosolic fatty-acid binding domain-containing protein n=1 Tax=Amblyomma maculatum TaxID=34609 RepID=G3MQU6_AMBMU
MRFTAAVVAITAVHAVLLFAPASAKAAHRLARNTTDTFELFAHFPYVVLEYTSGEDPEFQCLTNKRVQLDMKAKTATYVWMFKGHHGTNRQNVALHLSAGDTPDKAVFTLNDDSKSTWVAHFAYTDYKDCVIVEIPYDGNQCQLWVSNRVKDDVPQHCVDQLHDICDVSIKEYSKEACENGTDDL